MQVVLGRLPLLNVPEVDAGGRKPLVEPTAAEVDRVRGSRGGVVLDCGDALENRPAVLRPFGPELMKSLRKAATAREQV